MSSACGSCGAVPAAVGPYAAEVDACAACGAAMPISLPPDAASGFRLEPHAEVRAEWLPGAPRRLDAWCQPKPMNFFIATQATAVDDFDARVSLRLLEGNTATLAIGMTFRESKLGSYGFRVDGDGAFQVIYAVARKFGGPIIPWTSTPALRKGFGVTNQLRVVARGVSLQGWINGVLVFSLHDGRYAAGAIHATIEPGERAVHLIVTEFDVRDAP